MKKIKFLFVIILCLPFFVNGQSIITGIEAKFFYNQNKDYEGEEVKGNIIYCSCLTVLAVVK